MNITEANQHLEAIEARIDELSAIIETKPADADYRRQIETEFNRLLLDHNDTIHLITHAELTPAGEQLIIPGCEKRHDKATPAARQLGLWD